MHRTPWRRSIKTRALKFEFATRARVRYNNRRALLDKKYFGGIRQNGLRNGRTNCTRHSTTSALHDRRPKTSDYKLLPRFSNAVVETLGVQKYDKKSTTNNAIRNSHRSRFPSLRTRCCYVGGRAESRTCEIRHRDISNTAYFPRDGNVLSSAF